MGAYAFIGPDVVLSHVHGAPPRQLNSAAVYRALDGQTVQAIEGYRVLIERQGGGFTQEPIVLWHVRGGRARPVTERWGTLTDEALLLPAGSILWRGSTFESVEAYERARMGLGT